MYILRNSLTEVCALIDIMAVVKEKKCISISPIMPADQDFDYTGRTVSPQAITSLAGKKMVSY